MATIDVDLCAARMKRLMESWSANGDSIWSGASAVLVGTGVNKEDDLRYLKSVALEVWLFGYELPDTLILLTKTELHVVTSGKKGASDGGPRTRFIPSLCFPDSLTRHGRAHVRLSLCAILPFIPSRRFFKKINRRDPPSSPETLVVVFFSIHTQHSTAQHCTEDACLLYTSPSPRDATLSRMPSSA